jgi:hypothetical protein
MEEASSNQVKETQKFLKNKIFLTVAGALIIALVVAVMLIVPKSMSPEEAKKRLLVRTDFLSDMSKITSIDLTRHAYPFFGAPLIEEVQLPWQFLASPPNCKEDSTLVNMISEKGTRILASVDYQQPVTENPYPLRQAHLSEEIVAFTDEATASKFMDTVRSGYLNVSCTETQEFDLFNVRLYSRISNISESSEALDISTEDSIFYTMTRDYFPIDFETNYFNAITDRVTDTSLVRQGSVIQILQSSYGVQDSSQVLKKAIRKFIKQ